MKVRLVARVSKSGDSCVVAITSACKLLGIERGEPVFVTIERGPVYEGIEEKEIYNKNPELIG